jgi:tubulin-like protein CetZ
MGIKTAEVIHEEVKTINDDLDNVVVEESKPAEAVDMSKMKALRERLAGMQAEAETPDKIIKEEKKMTPKIVKKKSIKMGIIGSGQAGSRLAETFAELGYNAVAINTAKQDLEQIKLPEVNKLFLDYSIGGASKDQSIGHDAAQMHKDSIYELVKDKLGDSQVFVLCFSLGGGSGGGSASTLVDVLSIFEKPIVVITVLPMLNEDAQTKSNALDTLSNLSKMVQNKTIHNLIVADNTKIESIFADVGQLDFYSVSNAAICEPLDVFNTYSAMSSKVKSLDGMELLKILIDGEGLSLMGQMAVYNYEEDTSLAEAVITNLSSGLLASGFDLKQTKYAGVIILANEGVWARIPSSSINYAMSMIQDVAGTPAGIFRGIYEADLKEDAVMVYSFFSGLALPDARVEELKKEVAAQKSVIKEKGSSRNLNLNIDTGKTETVSAVENIKKKIEKKSSMFGKFTNQTVIDKRKK